MEEAIGYGEGHRIWRRPQEWRSHMNVEVRGVHLEVTENVREYIDKKLHRLEFAKNLVVDLHVNLSKDGGGYKHEAKVHFRWGNVTHVGTEAFDVFEGIDKLFDKMQLKINKEKQKVQEHRGNGDRHNPPATAEES